MQYRKLGRTSVDVSVLCLGTMTWGSQNTETEAHAQLDMALDHGINFIDTAEMYPTTPRKRETTGLTEEILGTWLQNRADRDEIVVATKVTGEGNSDVRGGARVNGAILREALEDSLRRLRTDCVDLYQLHWPNRGSYHFRKIWKYDPSEQQPGDMEAEVADLLGEVSKLQQEGKLKHFGLSNESAWGVMKFLDVATRHNLPRVVSVQNEYSLLCRIFDGDMGEVAVREDVGLLAFSPLAAGLLSGKYADGAVPAGTRMSMQDTLNGRRTEMSEAAVLAYRDVARNHGLDLAQMSLAFCAARPFMTSVIIGATDLAQLETNLGAGDLVLGDEAMKDIAAVHRRYPMPM